MGRKKNNKEGNNKSKTARAQCSVVKGLKDLKSGPTQVDKISATLPPQVITSSSEDNVQVGSNVKRNLFGTLPVELDEYGVNNKCNPFPDVNFSFCSPVKSEERIPNVVSIHESVSSALHQLPPLGDDDTPMTDNSYEQSCTEDDRWLENISTSAWEGKIDADDQEKGGANPARVLRRYTIQSASTRKRMDLQDDELQVTTGDIPRYSVFFLLHCH